eukprot:CAMPEP_0169072168 /NCGR_PEP_ID=MMETSP1015-20121227/6048_1 /TAXON_ID=342587 /ORGANISM="Karlodinium micrum, Strain CCMP2283" /LENGTH=610 /DNA_ID=CAMNT_0009131301 /DNA_START=71 /DNA_END=1901 /DNA_ORIENTATION=-
MTDAEGLDMSVYTIPVDTEVVVLEATEPFKLLTPQEQAYAEALGRADWEGAKICLLQCSAESVPIFSLLQLVYSAQPVEDLVASAKAKGVTEEEVAKALMYSAAFYGNLGNYKSFGDTKFVPALAADTDISARFLDSVGLSPYNTRLFKTADGRYDVLLASSKVGDGDDAVGKMCKTHEFEGKSFTVRRGDYAPLMGRIVAAIREALPHVANDQQKAMLERYIDSFTLGSIEEHKKLRVIGSRISAQLWKATSDLSSDPSGVRGEFEGFVSCVNKEVSRKFGVLVDNAEKFLTMMPWPKVFEKEVFTRPDFTSLEILSFGSSGVPAGINIPNYDDIRETEGFKNVSLGNVLKAGYGAGDKPVTFVSDADQAIFKKLKGEAFEVQVGIHELLGHGSGRLFYRDTENAKTVSATPHPLKDILPDCATISGPFYAEGTTWDSTFGKLASSYEECRAECCGLYLCLEPTVLEVFGHADATEVVAAGGIHDITYTNWLLMVKAGLSGLEFYTPETKAWRQAHMNARYVILRVLLEAGEGLVTLKRKTGANGSPDIEVLLDRNLISTVGKNAIGKFLLKLQVYKSLGDFAAGSKMFGSYSEVPADMAEIRSIVMAP